MTSQKTEPLMTRAERTTSSPQLDHLDQQDDRSSSLSELDEGLEEQLSNLDSKESTPNEMEVDSETETERLATTPRKLVDLNPPSSVGTGRSPSKLNQEISYDDSGSVPGSPLQNRSSSSSRKRKRRDPDQTSLSDADDLEPLPKRLNHSDQTNTIEREDHPQEPEPESEDEPERPEAEPLEGEPEETVEDVVEDADAREDSPADTPIPTEPTPATTRTSRGKKGKKKNRRGHVVETAAEPAEASEVDQEGPENGDLNEDDFEEEGTTSPDEELAKKKAAIESFAEIEKAFASFRRLQLEDSLRRIEAEVQLLDEKVCKHPEYLAQIQCIDKRRDEKVRYENVILVYDQQALRVRTVAEREQFHSQYFQACREIKDAAFEACNKEFYALQTDRRRYGTAETNDLMLYNPERAVQVKKQTAYNLEVSILSGIAKHVGFPSAPEIKGLSSTELANDLRAMGIQSASTRLATTQSFINAAKASARDAVDEQFLEQNPWAANPAHTNPAAMHTYHHAYAVTPAAQRTHVDPAANIGSASTLELPSNPPSSAVRPPPSSSAMAMEAMPNGKSGLDILGSKAGVAERLSAVHGSGALNALAAKSEVLANGAGMGRAVPISQSVS